MPASNGTSGATKPKVVLAYSGGLDTSVAIRWLQETKGLDVVALTLDLGQDGADLAAIVAKAKALGCVEAYAVDAKQEFCHEYLKPAIWANALYGGKYPLATALGRPLIAKHLVAVAQKEGAQYIAHGCTAKGNDQVRIEVATGALDPTLTTIAPMREWLYTRDEAVEYAEAHGIPVPVKKGKAFSVDENLWGRSIESGPIEDPGRAPPEEAFAWTTAPKDAPDKPQTVLIGFTHGVPTSLDGKDMDLVTLIQTIGKIAGAHGIGRIDQIEDRLVGIKSREVYEAPAAVALIAAHQEMEAFTLTKDVLEFKPAVEQQFSQHVYNGLFFSPLTQAITSFLAATQTRVNGTIGITFYKGSMTVASRQSPNALYAHDLATYGTGDQFDHTAAKGFIQIWGLPLKVVAGQTNQPKENPEDGPPLQTPQHDA
jgi:argininosuccinate synthase